jgi:hypothetical protein
MTEKKKTWEVATKELTEAQATTNDHYHLGRSDSHLNFLL